MQNKDKINEPTNRQTESFSAHTHLRVEARPELGLRRALALSGRLHELVALTLCFTVVSSATLVLDSLSSEACFFGRCVLSSGLEQYEFLPPTTALRLARCTQRR